MKSHREPASLPSSPLEAYRAPAGQGTGGRQSRSCAPQVIPFRIDGVDKETTTVMARDSKWKSTEFAVLLADGWESANMESLLGGLRWGKQVGQSLVAWMRARKGRVFDIPTLHRLGLTDNGSVEVGDGRPWEIWRIMYSSGKIDGFQADQYCASHRRVGGRKTFWMTEFHTVDTKIVGTCVSPISSDAETRQDSESVFPVVELVYGLDKQVAYQDWLEEYCRTRPDTFVPLGGPGHRSCSKPSEHYRVPHSPIYCHAIHGECLRAALANAMNALCGTKVAIELLNKGNIEVRSLAGAQTWLEKNMSHYHLTKAEVPVLSELGEWLSALSSGIFLVRILGKDEENEVVDHVVVLDASGGTILDCVEKVALRKEVAALKACVGDGFVLDEVAEVRRMEVQKMGKKRKNRKIPIEIRRKRKKDRLAKAIVVKRQKKKKIEILDECDDE